MTKFSYLIISHPRSGSNYLFDCLSRCSPGSCYNEPFRDGLNNTYVVNTGTLIKTHLNDFLNIDYKLQKKLLSTRHTVLLLRKDLFESAISDYIASRFKQWNSYSYSEEQAFIMDKHEMIRYVKGYIEYWKKFVEFKKNNKIDTVLYYEDFTFNQKKDLKKIFNIDKTYQINIKGEAKAPDKSKMIKNYYSLKKRYLTYIDTIEIDGVIIQNGKFTLDC